MRDGQLNGSSAAHSEIRGEIPCPIPFVNLSEHMCLRLKTSENNYVPLLPGKDSLFSCQVFIRFLVSHVLSSEGLSLI